MLCDAGLIGNAIFPEWLLTFLLLALLLFLAYSMVGKALRLHKCEVLEAARQQEGDADEPALLVVPKARICTTACTFGIVHDACRDKERQQPNNRHLQWSGSGSTCTGAAHATPDPAALARHWQLCPAKE